MKQYSIRLSVVLLAVMTLGDASAPAPGIFPTREGTEWTYSAKVKWTETKTNRVRHATLEWTSRIVKSLGSDSRSVLVIENFPQDLGWYEPGAAAQYTVIIEGHHALYIGGSGDRKQAEREAEAALRGAPIGEKVLRLPVRAGDCIRDPDVRPRKDHLYSWCVEAGSSGDDVKITYRSHPSHETLELARGKGVTHYIYEHHGTVAAAEVDLVSVH